jgi:hypothetical protein
MVFMPIPWLAALWIIPWGTLIAGAPAIARATDTLLTGAKARKHDLASAGDVRQLAERVALLEQHDQADAEILKQIGQQLDALTTATEVLAARVRWAMLAGVGALVLAVVGLGVAVASR